MSQRTLQIARMLIERTCRMVLITCVIATFASFTEAQSPGRRPWPRGVTVDRPIPAVPDLAAASVPVAETRAASKHKKTAVVGSWLGTSGEGNRLIASFHSDGIFTSSVQSEVSTIPELGVLTPGHGIWEHLGDRQFAVTTIGLLYDIDTGEYRGYLKARLLLTLDAAGDQMSGTDRVEIYGPDGSVVAGPFTGQAQYTRIEAEPFE
jgi:hypothetical protein